MKRSHRWLSGAVLMCIVVAPDAGARQPTASAGTRVVDLDGHRVRVLVAGLENRRPGTPVIVFESGAMNSLDAWRRIPSELAGTAPVVAYDRAGLGQSTWDERTPTPRHVADRLWRLLDRVGAAPPYVLVGWSWGGALARYYAGYHPDAIAGLVYVDPGPLVTQSPADEVAPFQAIGAGRAGYDAFWSAYASMIQRGSPAARAEFDVYRGLMQREVTDRDLRPAPDVPVVVIVAAKPMPPIPGLPYDASAHFQADLRHRVRILQEWALASSRGTLVMSNHTTHAVLREDPEVVVWAVRRVLASMPSRP